MNSGKLLKTAEVAERLGVDTGTVARYIREGILPATATAGGHYRVSDADLTAFIASAGRAKTEGAIIIALANQKGGVGKTTATANLGVLLWQMNLKVLLVDLDPQGHLTFTLGHDPDTLPLTIYDAMAGEREFDITKVILKTSFGPDLAPNNIVASNSDRELSSKPTWGTRLSNVLKKVRQNYDYILLDSGPSLNSLTVNALYAADYVVIPTQLEMLSVKGLQLLLERIDEARAEANPRLQIAGAVAMMVQQNNAARTMGEALRQALGQRGIRSFNTVVKRSVQFAEAANQRTVVAAISPRSEQTETFRQLLNEILQVVGGNGLDKIEMLDSGRKERGEEA
ncbi:MAG: AAA family ATPase [Chloroflexi bacterium]|uniref:AAA family ATPase n=1 Tax=Candidatus Chlorohelix allophototropha TaxID=3003348 RepID=A0A8T7M483_9CHLR|nr:AAA family ATPase [Chloroflexota bacterium]WJW70123.1 AAA family ATPase [Chloroflexota bacterium L227-S17]